MARASSIGVAAELGVEVGQLVGAFHAATISWHAAEMRVEGFDVENWEGFMEFHASWRLFVAAGPIRAEIWDRLQWVEPKGPSA